MSSSRSFVGADRGLKRLSLTTLGELPLIAPDDAAARRLHQGSRADATRPRETTVHDALSQLLSENGETTCGDRR